MITSNRATERLKEELIHRCFELGPEDVALTGDRLKEELMNRCLEFGLGFRILAGTSRAGKMGFNIRLDNRNLDDEVLDLHGIKVSLDPVSAARLRDYELDCTDGPNRRFYLRERQVERSL